MKLELRAITKRFGSLTANDGVDLVVEPGEIHALLGENGAGKSTLMNVLYGLYQPDEGQILVDDQPVTFRGPGDAIAAGIGMVHQHFMLIPVFTVTENVMLGAERTSLGFLARRRAARNVHEISERYGLAVPPNALVGDLPVGVQQRVEILKALSRDARMLVLDEPTAVLTPQETDELITVMRALRDGGTSIVFISHKLHEVRAIADKITVIRRGKVVGQADPSASSNELAALMVGRPVQLVVDKTPAKPTDVTLQVRDLTIVDDLGVVLVDDVSFDVRAGEIYAIAGVQGNGQTEVTEAIVGLVEPTRGEITVAGRPTARLTTDDILDLGVGYVPEDRLHDGLVGSFTVAENLILDLHDKSPFASMGNLDLKEIRRNAQHRVKEFDVRPPVTDVAASTLSGGNQQKVVLARELSRPLKLLIVAQPTRGLDVGSMEFVHRRIVEERDKGTAVVLVSTELDEVLGLADRIAVMYRGRIAGEVPSGASAEQIGLLMAGSSPDEARDAQPVSKAAAGTPETGGALWTVTLDKSEPGGEPPPEPVADGTPPKRSIGRRLLDTYLYANQVVVTALAFVVALVIGALLIAISDAPTRTALGYFTEHPSDTFSRAWDAISAGYSALFRGSIFNSDSLYSNGGVPVLGPISDTLVNAAPLILGGLAVTVAFRAGLFNIGVQGQLIAGAIAAGYVGFHWELPPVIALIAALAAGIIGGAVWGGIIGVLKARTGAHEVITTIMFNYVAVGLLGYLLTLQGFQKEGSNVAESATVHGNARLPNLFDDLHSGIIVAILAAVGCWWLLTRSTLGFRIRAVGANQNAARTAGIKIERSYIYVMLISGALSGLVGCSQVLGTRFKLTGDVDAGFGFDAITVALLGRGTTTGTVLAGILFGAFRAGGVVMATDTTTPSDIVNVMEPVMVLFIAAPALIRGIFRLRASRGGGSAAALAKGWNG